MTRSFYLAVWAPKLGALEPLEQQRRGEWILSELEHFSDRRQAVPPARWLLNLAGMEAVLGPPETIAHKLAEHFAAQGVELAIGVAATQTAALLASGRSGIHVIETADPAPALAPLSIDSLAALAACTPAAVECLELFARWGLKTLGEVARLPRRALVERLGRIGLNCQRWAQGEDQGLLLPAPEPPPVEERRQALEPPVEGYLPLLPWLGEQIQSVCAQLEHTDRALAEAAVQLDLDGRAPWSWRQRFPLPHREAKRLRQQIETALAMQPPLAPVTSILLRLFPCRPRRTQAGLFGNPEAEREPLERLVLRVRELLGDPGGERCGSPRLLDLHRSDQFVMTPFAPPAEATAPRAAPASPLCLRRRRPPPSVQVRLPPLPAPDSTAHPAGGWMQWPPGERRAIRRAIGPWRNSGEWWTDGAWSHDEWDVEMDDHSRFRLRHDRRTRQWFLLGEYD